jgi:hypothetical protein
MSLTSSGQLEFTSHLFETGQITVTLQASFSVAALTNSARDTFASEIWRKPLFPLGRCWSLVLIISNSLSDTADLPKVLLSRAILQGVSIVSAISSLFALLAIVL